MAESWVLDDAIQTLLDETPSPLAEGSDGDVKLCGYFCIGSPSGA